MKMKEKPKKENSERWLLTYSDLITLLMILFVMLFALSNVSESKYQELSKSLSDALGGGTSVLDGGNGVVPFNSSLTPVDLGGKQGNTGSNPGSSGNSKTPKSSKSPEATQSPEQKGSLPESLKTKEDMEHFKEYVDAVIDRIGLKSSISTTIASDGLVITFRNDVFFDSGQDALKTEMEIGLKQIATLLNKVDNKIVIEGSTDNVPIGSNSKFASNWQLSSARAANVAQFLVEQQNVNGKRVSAVGYGEYKPIASNATADGRTKNRRVDITIVYDSVEN